MLATEWPSTFFSFSLLSRQVSPNDFDKLDTLFKSVVKEKQPFVRLEMKKEDLLEMFKVQIIYL